MSTDTQQQPRRYKAEHVFRFKTPVCPYCGGKIYASASCWEQVETGDWIATELQVDCESEPDIDGPHWEGWWESHSHDYCQGWHDLGERLKRWLAKNVRFDLDPAPPNPRRDTT